MCFLNEQPSTCIWNTVVGYSFIENDLFFEWITWLFDILQHTLLNSVASFDSHFLLVAQKYSM